MSAATWAGRVGEFSEHLEKRAEPQALRQNKTHLRQIKKEQGGKPCSKNCVDPIFPKIGFDLD
jgi:hypothetical protein